MSNSLPHHTTNGYRNGDWRVRKGYSISELTAAVNQTSSIPQISVAQLFQVIYRCEDIYGSIVGNSFCVDGCLATPDNTSDDQCKLSGATTVTVTVTTAAPISCYKQCQTVCFGGECATCMMNAPANVSTMTPLLGPKWAVHLADNTWGVKLNGFQWEYVILNMTALLAQILTSTYLYSSQRSFYSWNDHQWLNMLCVDCLTINSLHK